MIAAIALAAALQTPAPLWKNRARAYTYHSVWVMREAAPGPMLIPQWARAYNAAKSQPDAFCAAISLAASLSMPSIGFEDAPDQVEFNDETLTCPPHGGTPVWSMDLDRAR